MKFLTPIDLSKLELQNARIHNIGYEPSGAASVPGQVYYNSVSNRLFYYNGSSWVGADAADAVLTSGEIYAEVSGAFMDRTSSSTNGYIPIWNGVDGRSIIDGYSVETVLSGGVAALPRADAVKTYIDTQIQVADAIVYKGTLGEGGTIASVPTSGYYIGYAYKIITSGTYAGHVCELGDMIIAIADRSSGDVVVNEEWTAIQGNLDGSVIGPASAVSGNFVIFDGNTGKVVKDAGINTSSFAPASHVTSGHIEKFIFTLASGQTGPFEIPHNFGHKYYSVTVREDAGSYAIVYTDIEMNDNTVVVKFAEPLTTDYTIIIIG